MDIWMKCTRAGGMVNSLDLVQGVACFSGGRCSQEVGLACSTDLESRGEELVVEGEVLGGLAAVNIVFPVTHKVLLVEESQIGAEEGVDPAARLTIVENLTASLLVGKDPWRLLSSTGEGGCGDLLERVDGAGTSLHNRVRLSCDRSFPLSYL